MTGADGFSTKSRSFARLIATSTAGCHSMGFPSMSDSAHHSCWTSLRTTRSLHQFDRFLAGRTFPSGVFLPGSPLALTNAPQEKTLFGACRPCTSPERPRQSSAFGADSVPADQDPSTATHFVPQPKISDGFRLEIGLRGASDSAPPTHPQAGQLPNPATTRRWIGTSRDRKRI